MLLLSYHTSTQRLVIFTPKMKRKALTRTISSISIFDISLSSSILIKRYNDDVYYRAIEMHFIAVRAFFSVFMGYEGAVDRHSEHLYSTHNGAEECPCGRRGNLTAQCLPVLSEMFPQVCTCRRIEHQTQPSLCLPQISTLNNVERYMSS